MPRAKPSATQTATAHAARRRGAAAGSGRPQRGIQSIEVGGTLLQALAHQGRPMALKDLAQAAGMASAKAHPYLVSLGKLGLIAQEAASGRYGLGPLALQLGLISLQQFDPIRLASARLADLAAETGHTVAVAVWGGRGPTIVRVEEAPLPVHVHMRHGTVMSIRRTATGRLFAAHMPLAEVRAALAAEAAWDRALAAGAGASAGAKSSARAAAAAGFTTGARAAAAEGLSAGAVSRNGPPARIDGELRVAMEQARHDGLAAIVDGAVAGVSAMAVPVFDDHGRMLLALTAIGPGPAFDTRLDGGVARALRGAARALSGVAGRVARP